MDVTTAKQTVVLAHINCIVWLCRDFITVKDIPLGANWVMVEKANVKVQQSIVFHICHWKLISGLKWQMKTWRRLTQLHIILCWAFAAVKPQTLTNNTVQCELLLHSSQWTQGLACALADYSAVHRLLQHWCVQWWCWWSTVKGVEVHVLFLGEYIRMFTLLCTIGQNISQFTMPNVPEILTKGIAECTQVWVSKACRVLEPRLPHQLILDSLLDALQLPNKV